MIDRLNLLEWSLNLRSDKSVKIYSYFECDILSLEYRLDILFLMETVKGQNVQIEGYTAVTESDNLFGNTVTIFIRNELVDNGDIEILGKMGRIPNDAFCNAPHFAQVDIKVNGIVYNLIAVRIQVFDSTLVEEFQQRRKQFDCFLNYITSLPNPIIMGDFNNAYIHGSRSEKYEYIKNHPQYRYRSQVQADYFYQKIKYDLSLEGLQIKTPVSGSSYGLIDKNKKFDDSSFKSDKDSQEWGYLQIDHLIIKNGVKINDLLYKWDFLNSALKNKINFIDTNEKDEEFIIKGFPDHAMLVAEICFEQDD